MAQFDSSLITDTIINTANTVAAKRLAPLNAFVRDFSSELLSLNGANQLSAPVISLTKSVPALQRNPTTFEPDTDGDVDGCRCEMKLYNQPMRLSSTDSLNGFSIKQFVEAAMNNICDGILSDIFAKLTAANFTNCVSKDLSGIDLQDEKDNFFQELYAATDKGYQKYAILNTKLYSWGAPVNVNSFDPAKAAAIRGFAGFYEQGGLPTITVSSATKQIVGLITDGKGLAVASRLPSWGIDFDAQETITLDNGLQLQYNEWTDKAHRMKRASLDVILGVGVYDPSATAIIYDAATISDES